MCSGVQIASSACPDLDRTNKFRKSVDVWRSESPVEFGSKAVWGA